MKFIELIQKVKQNCRNCEMRPVYAFLREHIPERANSSAVHLLESNEIDVYAAPMENNLVPFDHQFIEVTKAVSSSS